MSLLYLGTGILLLCAYPLLLLSRCLGLISVGWIILLAPLWIPALATVMFIIGLVGFISLFQFIIP